MNTTIGLKIIVVLIAFNLIAIFILVRAFFSSFPEDMPSLPGEFSKPNKQSSPELCNIQKKYLNDPKHNCSLLDKLSYEDYIASGWTKIVYRAKLNNVKVAVKSVNIKGKDVSDCARTGSILLCYNKAVDKFEKEITLLRSLSHHSIISLIYYCLQTEGEAGCVKHASAATELGDPLTNFKLLQMSWKQRRVIIQDLVSLIHYAENSPLGSLGIADLRRPQFILFQGRLKLADLDDTLIGDPLCTSDYDCSNLNVTIQCISNRCVGYNVRLNIQKSFKEFGPYLFALDDVPQPKRNDFDELKKLWLGNDVTTKQLLNAASSL